MALTSGASSPTAVPSGWTARHWSSWPLTPESAALAKDLKRRGWSFVGPTTVYAFMQAMGLVNDHLTAATQVTPWPSNAGRFKRPWGGRYGGATLLRRCRSTPPNSSRAFAAPDASSPRRSQMLKDGGRARGEHGRAGPDRGGIPRAHGARSGPILTYGYPGSICISVDEQVVHGVPGKRVLEPGRAGLARRRRRGRRLSRRCGDDGPGRSPVDGRDASLIDATRAALAAGIDSAQPG